MIRWWRQQKAKELFRKGVPRKIRIHSVHPQENGSRIAFEFLDPPGPWSMQFYVAAPSERAAVDGLKSGTEAQFYESEDGSVVRVMATVNSVPILPT